MIFLNPFSVWNPLVNENSKLGKGPIPFINNHWKKFDFQNLKNLILSCLRINPEDRITVDEAINHPWFDY